MNKLVMVGWVVAAMFAVNFALVIALSMLFNMHSTPMLVVALLLFMLTVTADFYGTRFLLLKYGDKK